ncbi:MAG: hypothetical protein AAGC43_04555 [Bacteroidota bacterium]
MTREMSNEIHVLQAAVNDGLKAGVYDLEKASLILQSLTSLQAKINRLQELEKSDTPEGDKPSSSKS